MMIFVTGILLGGAIGSLSFDVPKIITLVLGIAAGFCLGNLIGVMFVFGAIDSLLKRERQIF